MLLHTSSAISHLQARGRGAGKSDIVRAGCNDKFIAH